MAFNFSPKIVTNGLVLYLDAANPKSYVSGSTTWSDISRGGNNGALTNGPTFNSSNGGSIVFDGSNDYIDLGDRDAFDGFASYSLSVWVYINAFNIYTAFFHKWGATGYSYFLGAFNDNFKVTAGENYATNTGGKTGYYGDVSNTALQTGRWYNIVYTSTISNISLYINGVLDNSIANSWRGGNIINSITSLKLATHFDQPTYTNCRMSNSMIYNRALSATEVLQNYNATKTRFGL